MRSSASLFLALGAVAASACAEFSPFDGGLCRSGELEDDFPATGDDAPSSGGISRFEVGPDGEIGGRENGGDSFVPSEEDASNSVAPLAGCRYVGGSLRIVAQESVDLSVLRGLEEVENDLVISSNAKLERLTGLEGLRRVGGTIRIEENPALIDVSALTGLTEIHDIEIVRNAKLASFALPPALARAPAPTLIIAHNPQLATLTASVALPAGSTIEIIDNDALATLEGFGGLRTALRLVVADNAQLRRIDAFPDLVEVGAGYDVAFGPDFGVLAISTNATLEQIRFPRLEKVRNVAVRDNDSLRSLQGFAALRRIEERIFVIDNDLLADVSALYSLTYLGQGGSFSANAMLSACDAQAVGDALPSPPAEGISVDTAGSSCDVEVRAATDLEALLVRRKLTGDLLIEGPEITALDLPALTEVKGTVTIRNTLLTTLRGLANLQRITSALVIQGNGVLGELGLDRLESVQSITISANGLVVLAGPRAVSALGGLHVSGNSRLERIEGFEGLRAVDSLSLQSNGALRVVTATFTLTSGDVGNAPQLDLEQNPRLEGFRATISAATATVRFESNDALRQIELLGSNASITSLTISRSPALETLNAPVLRNVIESVELREAPRLRDLRGLAQIQSIGSSLVLQDLDAVAGLDGLERLASIGRHLEIRRNGALTTLGALSALDSVGGDLHVVDNQRLPSCQADQLAARLTTHGGSTNISGNAPCP